MSIKNLNVVITAFSPLTVENQVRIMIMPVILMGRKEIHEINPAIFEGIHPQRECNNLYEMGLYCTN